jgi:hypothetical protein
MCVAPDAMRLDLSVAELVPNVDALPLRARLPTTIRPIDSMRPGETVWLNGKVSGPVKAQLRVR